ncbi:MAG: aminoglycoside phosphotransferase family protein [Turicibacter sp.]|nr:aminoglycoside phosphotransferase family protein [Turicibacter sp.]
MKIKELLKNVRPFPPIQEPSSTQTEKTENIVNDIKDNGGLLCWRERFTKIRKVRGGKSSASKYLATDKWGNKFFVKIHNKKNTYKLYLDVKKRKHLLTHLRYVQDFPILEPLEYGLCSEGVYVISNWIDGVSLAKILEDTDKITEYNLGIQAGRLLRNLHDNNPSLSPFASQSWFEKFSNYSDNEIKRYSSCDVQFAGGDEVIQYINNNRQYIEGRPMCLIHGDANPHNILVQNSSNTYFLIDTDSVRHADPYQEFGNLFNSYLWPVFSTGYVNGYFSASPPESFWKIIRVYLYTEYLRSARKIDKKKPKYSTKALESIKNGLEVFENQNNSRPTWYLESTDDALTQP